MHWRRRVASRIFGDLITAYHKVLREECEYRINHRYALVVQHLGIQWIQFYQFKTQTSEETEKSLQKFLEPTWNIEVNYTDNSLEFGKACEDLSWNHCTSTPHSSETKGIVESAVRRVKEGFLFYCWYHVQMTNGGRIPWSADAICEQTRSVVRWENIYWIAIRRTIRRTNNSGWFDRRITLYFCQRFVATPSAWQESVTMNILRLCNFAGGSWKVDILIADIEELEKMDASEIR